MTTGTTVSGDQFSGSNASGAYTRFNQRATRTWSGTDYPSHLPKPPLVPELRSKTVVAWEGDKQVVTVYPVKFYANSGKKPRRAYTEEHPYSSAVVIRHDPNEVLYKGNPQQGFSPIYPLTQQGQGFTGVSDSSYGWNSNHDLQLVGRLRDKVAGSSFNAGVFLGEGKEALNMIAESATRLYWGYHAAKRGDFRSAARYLTRNNDRKRVVARETPSSNWLQLQYGWLPLLSDVHDGARFLAHHLDTPLQHVVRASVTSKGVTSGPTFQGNGTLFALNAESYRQTHLKAVLKEKDVYKLAGLTDPLSVAWELVPYSFVLDWFLPIGDYLAARGLSSSLTGTFVYSTKKVRSFSGLTGVGSTLLSPPISRTAMKEVYFTRTVSTSLQVPNPSMIPLSEAISWKRAANAVALLSQLKR